MDLHVVVGWVSSVMVVGVLRVGTWAHGDSGCSSGVKRVGVGVRRIIVSLVRVWAE